MLRRRRHIHCKFFTRKAPSDVELLISSSHATICASLLDAAADVGVDVFAAVDATTLSSTFLRPYYTTSPWLPEIIPNKAWTSSKSASASKSLNPSKQCTPSLKILRWSFTRHLHRPCQPRLHVCTWGTSASGSETKFVTCVEPTRSHTSPLTADVFKRANAAYSRQTPQIPAAA